jgi:hypothetical protein
MCGQHIMNVVVFDLQKFAALLQMEQMDQLIALHRLCAGVRLSCSALIVAGSGFAFHSLVFHSLVFHSLL